MIGDIIRYSIYGTFLHDVNVHRAGVTLPRNKLVWEIAVLHLAIAGDVLMASFCAVLFPIRCLG